MKMRMFRRELIGFLLTVWFALSIALVETSLQSVLLVRTTPSKSRTCLQMDRLYDVAPVTVATPPFRYSIDDWALNIGQQLGCDETGLLSIDLGGIEGPAGDGNSTRAPMCVDKSKGSNQFYPWIDQGFVDIERFKVHENGLFTENPVLSIIPYDNNVGLSRPRDTNLSEPYIPIDTCDALNIAAIPLRYFREWDIANVDDYNVTRNILKQMCTNLDKSSLPKQVPRPFFDPCLSRFYINMTCVRVSVPSAYHSSVIVSNASMLIIQEADKEDFIETPETTQATIPSRTVACPEVELNISYVLLPVERIYEKYNSTIIEGQTPINSTIMVPYRIQKIGGVQCEPSLHILGFSALIYTANLEWESSQVVRSEVGRTRRYQTFMIAMARTIYPFDQFKLQLPKNTSAYTDECNLRKIEEVTLVLRNWGFYLLICITLVNMLFSILSFAFQCIFPTRSKAIDSIIQRYNDPLQKTFDEGRAVVIGPNTDFDGNEIKEGEKTQNNFVGQEFQIEALRGSSEDSGGYFNDTSYRIVPVPVDDNKGIK